MRNAAGPPGWVFRALAVGGAATTAINTLCATRVFLTFGTHHTIVLTLLVASVALVSMALRSYGTLRRCVRRLAPVGVLACASLIVAAIASTRMPSGSFSFLRVMLGPTCWIASAVLGYLGGRSRNAALGLGATVGLVSMAAAIPALAAVMGFESALSRSYASWSASLGAFVPPPGTPFRAVGLEIDPNTYGMIGAVVIVAALCIHGRAWLRAAAGVSAASVIVLSGSRTALAAVVLTSLVVAVVERLTRRAHTRDRLKETAIVALTALAAAALLMGVIRLAGAGVPLLQRVAEGTGSAAAEVAGGSTGAALDVATSGRVEVWSAVLRSYARHPFGAFVPPEFLIGKSVHNEFLERLLYGGPLLLAVFVAFLVWIAIRVRPPTAPALGPAIATVYAAAAMMLGPSLLPPFFGMAFYLIGWGRAQPDSPRRSTEAASAAGA